MASAAGHLDIVKTLIEAEANIDQADEVSTHSYPCMTSKPVINAYLCACDQATQHAGRRICKIMWGISHYMRCIVSTSYSVAIEHHCGSDEVETMQSESII